MKTNRVWGFMTWRVWIDVAAVCTTYALILVAVRMDNPNPAPFGTFVLGLVAGTLSCAACRIGDERRSSKRDQTRDRDAEFGRIVAAVVGQCGPNEACVVTRAEGLR